jgi:cyclase
MTSVDRRSFLAAASAAAAFAALAPASFAGFARGSRALPWAELADGVSAIADLRLGGNVMVVGSRGSSLLIDTTYPFLAHALREEALEAGERLTVVNTHHHGDHTGGNFAFAGDAGVHAHANAIERVRGQIERYRAGAEGGVAQAGRLDMGEAVIASATRAAEVVPTLSADAFVPTRVIADGASTLRIGDVVVELFHFGPGHTDNDVVVRLPGANVVHTGDLVFNGTHPFFDATAGVSPQGWIASLWRAHELCDASTVVVPGHGAVGDRGVIRTQIDYVQQLIESVSADIDAGVTREDATAKTYPFMEGLQFESIRPRAIGVVYDDVASRR